MSLLARAVCTVDGHRPGLGADHYRDGHAERTLRCTRCGALILTVDDDADAGRVR